MNFVQKWHVTLKAQNKKREKRFIQEKKKFFEGSYVVLSWSFC